MVVNLKFQSGAIANLWACCSANGGGGGVSLQVYATETTAHFTGWEHSVRIYRRNEDIVEIRGEGDIFRIEDEVFVKALQTGDRSLIRSDYIDGAKTAAVTLAAVKSAETGKPVEVEPVIQ
jgi:predicted dehydrogenase